MGNGDNIRTAVLRSLHEISPNAYRGQLNGCVCEFPESAWENARAMGMSFFQVLMALHPHAYEVLDGLTGKTGLQGLYFTSIYRSTGGGPHTLSAAVVV